MPSYKDLKTTWRQRLERGEGGCCFDLDQVAPEKFYILYSDAGCSGTCCSHVQAIGIFEDARDFLSFLRFSEIPRVCDFDSGTLREPCADIADAYILKYDVDQRERIDHLVGRIDKMLKSPNEEAIFQSELCLIRCMYNEIFSQTNPQVEVVTWGHLEDILASDYFEEEFQEDIEDEVDDNEKSVTTLKRLLDTSEFDESNYSHRLLVKHFLKQTITF